MKHAPAAQTVTGAAVTSVAGPVRFGRFPAAMSAYRAAVVNRNGEDPELTRHNRGAASLLLVPLSIGRHG